jgi:hypothetical protein
MWLHSKKGIRMCLTPARFSFPPREREKERVGCVLDEKRGRMCSKRGCVRSISANSAAAAGFADMRRAR